MAPSDRSLCWLLARLGKRVLRPGGLGLTQLLLDGLSIGSSDEVIEFAPGLRVTARLILNRYPRRYVEVKRVPKAMEWTTRQLPRLPYVSVVVGMADETNLADGSASVVLGEAMLSMNTQAHKRRIAAEAFRLLRRRGRYGIHELCVVPDDMPADLQQEIDRTLSSAIHVGARPLPAHEWKALLEEVGSRVVRVGYAPMHLLCREVWFRTKDYSARFGSPRICCSIRRRGGGCLPCAECSSDIGRISAQSLSLPKRRLSEHAG